AGRGGLLQLPDVSWSPCCRSHPAGGAPPRQPDCDGPCCLRAKSKRSASGATHFRGYPCVHSRYGPVTRSLSLLIALSMGFRASVSLCPAIQATGSLALTPVRLPPTEHVCLPGRALSGAEMITGSARDASRDLDEHSRGAFRPHLDWRW